MLLTSWRERLRRNPFIRVGVALGLLLALAGGATALVMWARVALFAENSNFTLRRVVINSQGIWKERPEEIIETLGLVPHKTNIFAVDLAKARRDLTEKLPSIEEVQARRILPDTLAFDIVERVPRALIYPSHYFNAIEVTHGTAKALAFARKRANAVLDSHGVLLLKEQCVTLDENLPVITGLKTDGKHPSLPGTVPSRALPVVELINTLNFEYPTLPVKRVDLSVPGEMLMTIPNPAGDYLQVKVPETNFQEPLKQLKNILLDLGKNNIAGASIDLTFNNQAVVEPRHGPDTPPKTDHDARPTTENAPAPKLPVVMKSTTTTIAPAPKPPTPPPVAAPKPTTPPPVAATKPPTPPPVAATLPNPAAPAPKPIATAAKSTPPATTLIKPMVAPKPIITRPTRLTAKPTAPKPIPARPTAPNAR